MSRQLREILEQPRKENDAHPDLFTTVKKLHEAFMRNQRNAAQNAHEEEIRGNFQAADRYFTMAATYSGIILALEAVLILYGE